MATNLITTDDLYDAQQTKGSRRRNYDYFKENPTQYVKHDGQAPKLDFNMNYLKQKGHQLGYNRKYFYPAAAKAMAYRNGWAYGQEDIDADEIPDIYATDATNNLMMFNGAFASKLDKDDHRRDVIDYYSKNDRYQRRQTDFTDYMIEEGKKEAKTARQKIVALFRTNVKAAAGTKYAAKQFNDLLFDILTHAAFAGLEDRRLSDEKSKLFATKGGKAILEQVYQTIAPNETLRELIIGALNSYSQYLNRERGTSGDWMYKQMIGVARKINANPIPQEEWFNFLMQVEAMKKAKRDMKLGKAMEGYDLNE